MSPHGRRGVLRLDRRGAVAILFACALPMLIVAVGAGIEFSRIAAARAALQRAVDNAALSGAAAYVLYTATDSFKGVAVSTANASFCKAVAALPAGASLVASTGTGAARCDSGPGPTIAAAIGGYVPGTRGTAANTGCSATNTVVAGVTCGFWVTVSAAATVGPTFGGFLGGARTLTVSATAINPFLDLGSALAIKLGPSGAWSATSIWVYPLRLDANGNPDFTANLAARPPTTDCTGAPDQTKCGSYTMLASTYYQTLGCPQSQPCTTADGATIVGGVVQNPKMSAAVITATTPLGFALEVTTGGNRSYGLDSKYGSYISAPTSPGCGWPAVTAYNTITQVYPPATTDRGTFLGLPPSKGLEGRNSDGSIDWSLTTRWFYSSYLANPAASYPPNYDAMRAQLTFQPTVSQPGNQKVQSVPTSDASLQCNNTTFLTTTFPTTGNTNCSLYIVKDPPSPVQPDPSYNGNRVCWSPANTPGRQYAALSCQGFAGHTFAFFWNNMAGQFGSGDNTDYADGTAVVSCSGSTTVRLID